MAGYQKEILPSSWSPIVNIVLCYNINSEEKEALGANIKRNEKLLKLIVIISILYSA